METLANVDGRLMPLKDVTVSAMDRGFLFGDAVYEVLRVYKGKPFLAKEHMSRLAYSLESIRIQGVDVPRIAKRMADTIAAGPFEEAIVYIQVTRGAAPRSHGFPKDVKPFELLYVQEFKDPYAELRSQGAPAVVLPDIRWKRCEIKSTNLLANVLALQAAKEAGCTEALLELPDGSLGEGTHTSFFAVLDGVLRTAPKSPLILPGCTRDLVIRLAHEQGLAVVEKAIMKADLERISELFLTGTTSEVLPIVRVDSRPIGSGKPGPVSKKLQGAYDKVVQELIGGKAR
jgi:D-alanine transaminase